MGGCGTPPRWERGGFAGIWDPYEAVELGWGIIMRTGAALLGAATVIALSAPATAGRLTSWYGVFEGGGNAMENVDIEAYVTTPATVSTVNAEADTDIGWAALASVGYAYSNGWRMELEGGYRHNGLSRLISAGGLTAPATGDLDQYTLMANVLYDFPSASGVTFTFGAGVGADYARLDASSLATPVQDEDIALAFQAIAGLSYEITNWLDLVLNYRYLYVTDMEFSEPAVAPNVNHVDTDALQQHLVTLGVRFGSHKSDTLPPLARKAAPPPPPPSVARQFVIYFGFNKCNITADADAVLSEAASAAQQLGSVAVKIVGHTDTVGSRTANQRLSECRAGAAKTNLVGKGVPSGSITASGAGETQLLVQTADSVKEPQNRRATIDLN